MTTALTKAQEEKAIILTEHLTRISDFVEAHEAIQNEIVRRLKIELTEYHDVDEEVSEAITTFLSDLVKPYEMSDEEAAEEAAKMEELIPSTIKLQPD